MKDSDVQCAWQMASRVGLHDLDGTLAAERTRTRTMPSADVQQLAPINEDGSGASGSESNSSISSAGSDTSHGSPANVQAKNRPRSDETTRAVRTPSNALGPVAGRAASPFIASPFPGAKIRAWSQLESQQPLLSEMATEVVEAPPVGKAAGSGTLDQRFAHLLEGHRQQMDPDEVKKGYLAVVDKLYKKISVMGKGGGGKVYKVHAAEDESQVFAVKKIKLVPNDDDLRESVFNEIALLVALSGQPSIIKMYDYEIADEYVYMVMECGEQDLAQALAKKQVRSLRGVWRAMIESLQTVHDQRVVHGDLKPANFLMVNRELKLIDFGIARKIESDNTNQHHARKRGRDRQLHGPRGLPGYTGRCATKGRWGAQARACVRHLVARLHSVPDGLRSGRPSISTRISSRRCRRFATGACPSTSPRRASVGHPWRLHCSTC